MPVDVRMVVPGPVRSMIALAGGARGGGGGSLARRAESVETGIDSTSFDVITCRGTCTTFDHP